MATKPKLVQNRYRPAASKEWGRYRERPGYRSEKKLIERAYCLAESLGIAVWCEDEAGPFQTVPDAAPSWHREGQPQRQDHEYLRNGTAKVLTLFHPTDGQVRLKGVEQTTNAVLHPWLKTELTAILDTLSDVTASVSQADIQQTWHQWREDLTVTFTLPEPLPPLRLLLVWDNLQRT